MRVVGGVLAALLVAAGWAPVSAEPRTYKVGEIKAGDRIQANLFGRNQWVQCTVLGVDVYGNAPDTVASFSAQCADGTRYDVTGDTDHVKPAGAAPNAQVPPPAPQPPKPPAPQAPNPPAKPPNAAPPANANGLLRDGLYHCKVDFNNRNPDDDPDARLVGTMWTYGDFRITGNRYEFIPGNPNAGAAANGTYQVNADRTLTFFGDIGVMTQHVLRNSLDGVVPDSFWFEYDLDGNDAAGPRLHLHYNSCSRL